MTVFANVEDLKEAILGNAPEEFFDQFVVGRETVHFDGDKLDFVSQTFLEEYGVAPSRDQLIVVGSSKLGFALHSKRQGGAEIAPAFRRFSVESDIDLSICSPDLFDLLWHEISAFMCTKRNMPFRQRNLGDYLSYGWLRTDHLPNAPAPHLIKCDNLRFVRGRIRRDRQRGHPKINFGIFHDVEHLKLYQARSINVCRQTLENPL
jgi:hypothetical protein